jgi:hypothetical protein
MAAVSTREVPTAVSAADASTVDVSDAHASIADLSDRDASAAGLSDRDASTAATGSRKTGAAASGTSTAAAKAGVTATAATTTKAGVTAAAPTTVSTASATATVPTAGAGERADGHQQSGRNRRRESYVTQHRILLFLVVSFVPSAHTRAAIVRAFGGRDRCPLVAEIACFFIASPRTQEFGRCASVET